MSRKKGKSYKCKKGKSYKCKKVKSYKYKKGKSYKCKNVTKKGKSYKCKKRCTQPLVLISNITICLYSFIVYNIIQCRIYLYIPEIKKTNLYICLIYINIFIYSTS